MNTGIPFPDIDPVAISIPIPYLGASLDIRWYALAYIVGLVLGWRYVLYLARKRPLRIGANVVDDLLVWVAGGVILGGRLGYVLFYRPEFYLANPFEIIAVWKGGMSFHGGLLGVIVAMILFARHRGISLFSVADLVACAAPIGLFFGRIANFVNGELFGRAADVPWAMVFPRGGPIPRHPSQLYEAGLEGLLLFAILAVVASRDRVWMRPGLLAGLFMIGYALARSFAELFREPDPFLGFLISGMTMGQLLSIPVFAIGVYLVVRAPSAAAIDGETQRPSGKAGKRP